ncbi:MAG: DNA polymerase III subunit beta [Parcubacteria group bacterium Gr01-1014_56]|nr:MAG: DNA polymerase III subunit beta [Parcubacteria group bacterium Gr01-1014_56]
MKFDCGIEQLLTAVSLANRFVERRANLPVLSSIFIAAEGGHLTLRATNLECGVEVSLPAKINKDGVVSVPGGILAGFLSNARGKSITGELVGGVLKLQTERVSASIKTTPHEDFPILPHVSASSSFTIKTADIARAIRSVAYCASTSAIKPELQSILLYAEAGKLITAATDSFRLAEKTVPLRSSGSVPQLLLPARNATELYRILETTTGEIEIYYNEHQISTHIGAVYYTSRLLDGAFPNYRQIVPKSFSTEAVVLREDMAQALKSLSIFADKSSQVSLSIDSSNKTVVLSSRNPDVGEQVSTLRATLSGEAVAMNFNGRYLADSLQAITGESVRLHSNGPGKPLLVKDASDDSFFYLAMPMNR